MGCGARTVRPWTGGLRPREGQDWGLQPMKAEAQLTSLGCVLAGAAEDSVADTLRQMGGSLGRTGAGGWPVGSSGGSPRSQASDLPGAGCCWFCKPPGTNPQEAIDWLGKASSTTTLDADVLLRLPPRPLA